ncbi:hypothetical protein [Leptospira sp. GIMC2001]|uniref:hypothetical protein n=1 Tax=Leptospira sp. GIMC2001 TaxID=1513297 RepID=UPI00234BD95A|nr:hypothetical protein [Leptospira sp. GIMC2001]WCL50861.1 hypothetical protein O4O04_08620 [Leptospira sp. GIMC2001]
MNKKIILFLILIAGLELVASGTTLSIRERKKQIDSKLKIVDEVDIAMGGWNLERYSQRSVSIKEKLDLAYRENTAAEIGRVMTFLEGDLHMLQISYAEATLQYSQELIESYARSQITATHDKTAKDLNRKEKVQRYYDMAKKEKENAKKYLVMNNPNLSLHALKRSILYSFHSYREAELALPTKYHTTYSYWMKDMIPGSSQNLETGKVPASTFEVLN